MLKPRIVLPGMAASTKVEPYIGMSELLRDF